jgi:PD-(D/E)XK nuclease superfamily protein
VVLTTDQKGNIAEAAITAAAIKLGVDVYRPLVEGARYDLIFDIGTRLLRVQCKWAARYGDILIIRCYSSRRGVGGRIVCRRYTDDEVDAFAAYSEDTDRCYLLPVPLWADRRQLHLRLAAARNNQKAGTHWAADFEFAARLGPSQGAIAQLGERVHGMHEGAGSSPAGSTPSPELVGPQQIQQVGDPDQGVLQIVEPSLPQD